MKQLLAALTALLKVKTIVRAVSQRKRRAGQVSHHRNNGRCVLFWNAE